MVDNLYKLILHIFLPATLDRVDLQAMQYKSYIVHIYTKSAPCKIVGVGVINKYKSSH